MPLRVPAVKMAMVTLWRTSPMLDSPENTAKILESEVTDFWEVCYGTPNTSCRYWNLYVDVALTVTQ